MSFSSRTFKKIRPLLEVGCLAEAAMYAVIGMVLLFLLTKLVKFFWFL